LACPEHLLTDHPADTALLRGLCERDGYGLVQVDWYRQWRWLLEPRPVADPAFWQDCLEGYASGDALRALVRPPR